PESARASSKRKCVASACVPCRKRKSKCDGSTPVCSTCTAVYKTECFYDGDNDNRRKVTPRKDKGTEKQRDGVPDKHDSMAQVLANIRNLQEPDLSELIQRIRNNEDLDVLAESYKHSSVTIPRTSASQTLEGELSVLMGKPSVAQSGVRRHFSHASNLGLVPEKESSYSLTHPAPGYHESWTTITDDQEFIDHLLKLYFTWCHPFFECFSEEWFLHDMKHRRTTFCSGILVNSILAFACHFSERPAARTDPSDPRTAGDHFHAEAKRLLNEDDRSCLTTVQALAVLCLREPSMARDSTGYQYAGRCMRMAIELGLHLSFCTLENLSLTKAELEVRKITFWGCFTIDTAWSLCIGRLPQHPRTAIELDKLTVTGQEESKIWRPYYDEDVRAPHQLEHKSHARQFLLQFSLLSELVNDVTYMFFAPRERLTSRKVLDSYQKYRIWYDTLPDCLDLKANKTAHNLVLHMFYHTCVLHLFRPLLKVDVLNSRLVPRDVCLSSATEVSNLVDEYRGLYGLRCTTVLMTHILLSSCTVHLLDLPAKAASDRLCQGLRDLESMSINHRFAARGYKIIVALSKSWGYSLPANIPQSPTLLPKDDVNLPNSAFFASTVGHLNTINMTQGLASHNSSQSEKLLKDSYSLTPTLQLHTQSTYPTSTSYVTPPSYSSADAVTTATVTPPSLAQVTQEQQQGPFLSPHPSEQLFWSPFPGQGIPLLGSNINVSPMDLSNMLQTVDEWEQFNRDGFQITDNW
ncbi:hypothetical protein M501DRAFT_916607, partial [Patellaria atrata CBS 101060]